MKDFLKREGEVGRYVVKKVVSLMILWLVKKKERTGYEIIAIFENAGLRHAASAARVYPLLGILEKAGFLSKKEAMQGKRRSYVYRITPEGKARMEYASKWLKGSLLGQFFREMLDANDARTGSGRMRARLEGGYGGTLEHRGKHNV